ncbi:DUF4157 domain-containing protein [Streptomyces sp. MMG1121]|uniref:eCIS core domain-containing protein n=1 Tax=Streptomyces sp. MMG1121 TaxID=1415544 RepID=UPI003B63BEC1
MQLLRRAGHPGAQERHQHGPGCGHENEQEQSTAEAAPTVQRSAVHGVLRGSGRPLDASTRTDMEARLGADFSAVRVHTGAEARRSAAEIGARAYTSGEHVVIGDGGADRHTLAHELTHVIQQRKGPVSGTDNGNGLSVSDPGDRFEREAEANARRALSSPVVARAVKAGHAVHGAEGGSPAPAVQRARERKRGREEDNGVSAEAIAEIANPVGREPTYDEGSGQARRIPKTAEGAACWEWAVRAAADSGGIDRGQYWDYLTGWIDESAVAELDRLEPAVKSELDQLRGEMQSAGLSSGPAGLDEQHDEETIRPFMQRSVENFVTAHGLRIQHNDPAGWVMCHYKMTGTAGAPEHWWIELPTPEGSRVLVQTVPDIDHFEAGGTELRWNDPDSVEGRRDGHETYVTIEVPIAALKGRHTEILNGIVGRRLRRRGGR